MVFITRLTFLGLHEAVVTGLPEPIGDHIHRLSREEVPPIRSVRAPVFHFFEPVWTRCEAGRCWRPWGKGAREIGECWIALNRRSVCPLCDSIICPQPTAQYGQMDRATSAARRLRLQRAGAFAPGFGPISIGTIFYLLVYGPFREEVLHHDEPPIPDHFTAATPLFVLGRPQNRKG